MCGIFALVGDREDAAEVVLKGLKLLEYRGYDSWGVASLPLGETEFVVEKHVGKIGAARLQTNSVSNFAVGHTRWATHGGVTVANTHPHLSSEKEIVLVHNGIIENYQALKTKLRQKKYSFVSETDTEVVVYLIEEYLQKMSFLKAVQAAFLECAGLNALVILNQRTQELIAVRKGSPLAVGQVNDGFLVASDATAMSEYTNQVYFLADHDLIVATPKTLQLYDVRDLSLKKITWQQLEFVAEDLSKGAFEHFMLKEISEQPRVLVEVATQLRTQIVEFASEFRRTNFLVGCGTSYHASLLGSYFFSLIAQRSVAAVAGSEFGYTRPGLGDDSFVTFISQSGETIDLLEQVSELQATGQVFGAIVNRLGSSLERATTHKLLMPAGPEQCVLATKSFSATVGILYLLAHALGGTQKLAEQELLGLATYLPSLLTPEFRSTYIQSLAERLFKKQHLFVIGRGVSYPVALEAALKIKEVTYIHTEGFAGGELKHGVIALIESGTPCIVFAPSDETYATTISNAMELKSRGAFIIGLSETTNEVFDFHVPIKNYQYLSALPNSIAIQLLAYEIALLKGNDPDKPRNLAKSVTVK